MSRLRARIRSIFRVGRLIIRKVLRPYRQCLLNKDPQALHRHSLHQIQHAGQIHSLVTARLPMGSLEATASSGHGVKHFPC